MSVYDPLGSSPFASEIGRPGTPPWPTTPHQPNSPIPNLPRSSASPSTPFTAESPTANPFGREPQIYGQPDQGLISPAANAATNGKKFERTEPYLRVRITALDRNRRDILVRLDAQTNLSNFTGSTYRNISRSYLEFQQFYESIVTGNPQTIIPALPLPQTSAPTDEEDDRLIKIMLQRWLTRICEDPILLHDEDVRAFIESDFGYQPTPRVRRKAGSGFSLMGRRGVPDEDEDLARARFELTKLEGQFLDAAKGIDKLSKARKTLALGHAEMGNKLISVATTEAHPPLGNAFRKIGRAWHSLADLDQAQAISECVILADSLGYQSLNARSAKETLLQRTAVLEDYQMAVKTTIGKRRHIERLKASGTIRPDRVDEALEDMEEANKYEQILARRVDGISQNLHRALQVHNRLANEDITTALIEHARSTVMYERQLLRELEALRPDVNGAAKKVPQPSANGVPRPTIIPPLEDFSTPPPPQVSTSGPTTRVSSPLHHPDGTLPSRVVTDGSVSVQRPLPPQQSPGAGPSSPVPQQTFSSPIRAQTQAPIPAPLPPPPPSPTPFSPSPAPTSSLQSGPPLGGRWLDGSKSMFVQPSHRATTPLSPSSPSSAGAQTPTTPHMHSPLHASTLGRSSTNPLMSNGAPDANGRNGAADVDPLGLGRPNYMSSSVRVQPSRPRLDAREAASKLANFL